MTDKIFNYRYFSKTKDNFKFQLNSILNVISVVTNVYNFFYPIDVYLNNITLKFVIKLKN